MKIWDKIFTPQTFIGSILIALVAYFIIKFIDPWWDKKLQVIKIYGSVLEKKEKLLPVYNASVHFLNISDERTDTNGQFSAQLKGRGSDSITIEVILPDEQRLNRKIFIEYGKKEMFLAPLVFPVSETTTIIEIPREKYPKPKNKTFNTGDSNKKNATDKSSGSISDIKQKASPTEIINESEKADFAIMAITNEKQDNQLARVLVDWLKNSGTSSQSILQNLFIEQGFFNQIIDGNSAVIKKTSAVNSAKYVCLVRAKIDYSKSEINNALIVATCDYETVIIETATAKVIATFIIPAKSSGISKEMAKLRAESDFINELNKRKLTI
jgi:hypothetical protein